MGKPFSLVIQSFGNEKEYRRAVFTIISFFSFTDNSRHQVCLFTDNPAWFNVFLSGLPIHYEFLDAKRIREMRGRIDFIHRMKIAAIEFALNTSSNDILYADSDTFFTSSPEGLMDKLNEKTAFMHLHEYQYSEMDIDLEGSYGLTMNSFIDILRRNQIVDHNGNSFPLSLSDSSWNAGVMFLHHSHLRLIPDVYTLTDQFYPESRNHASEQYAFSIVLQRNVDLYPCDKVIYHYWYRVKKDICDLFFSMKITNEWGRRSIDNKLSDVREWVQILPISFDRHPLMLRDNAIQAFNENNLLAGYKWSAILLFKSPRHFIYILRDIFYFTIKRFRANAL